MSDAAERELRAALLNVALKLGEGVDDRGDPMAWTLDCRELVLASPAIRLAGRLLWRRVRAHRPELVGGLTLSADPLVVALLYEAALAGHPLGGLIVRRAPKAHGLRKLIEGPPVRPGARVVLVDDLVSSGRALAGAARAIRERGGNVVAAAVLVDFGYPSARERLRRLRLGVDSVFTLADLGLDWAPASGRASAEPAWRRPGIVTSTARAVPPQPVADDARGAFVVGSDAGFVESVDGAGGRRWRRPAPRLSAGPVVCGDRVLFGAGGALHCVAAADGAPLWTAAVGDVAGLAGPEGHAALSAGSVAGIDLSSGAVRWRTPLDAAPLAGPVLADGRVVVGGDDGWVRALDAAGGELLWATRVGGTVRGPPLVDRELVVLGAYDGVAYALDAAGGRERWRRRLSHWLYCGATAAGTTVVLGGDREVAALDRATGEIAWMTRVGGRVIGAPALVPGGLLCVGTEAGDLNLLDAATGEPAWRVRLGAIRATPAVLGDLLAVPSADGYLSVFRARA